MGIPNDPMILLSYINTQLRDNFLNLTDFCRSMDCSMTDISVKLNGIGYGYDPERNQFIPLGQLS